MNKGIVMEMTQAHLVVLTPNGRFMKIPRSSRVCEVGDEIVFTTPVIRWKSPFLTFTSSVAAAVLLCVVAFTSITPTLGGVQQVVAYVTLDINPSVEMGIDAEEDVQEIRGLNDDGVMLIEQLSFKGKSLSSVTSELLDRVELKGLLDKGEGDIIISSTKAFEDAKVDDTAVGESVKKSVDKHIQTNHPENQADIHVAALVAPLEMRQAALSEGVSPGKYAIYLNAKNNGNAVTIQEIKSQSIHTIAQERGGIDKLIDTKKVPQKDTLSKLLDEEKKGELDARLQAMQSKNGGSDKKDDDKKSNAKQENKATPTPTPKKTPTPTPTPKKTNPPATPISLDRDKKDRDDEKAREDDRKRQEEIGKKQEEERNKREEQEKADEKRKQEDERKKQDDDRKKQDDEKNRLEELKKKQEEEKKKQEEERKRDSSQKSDDSKRDNDKLTDGKQSDDKDRNDDRSRN